MILEEPEPTLGHRRQPRSVRADKQEHKNRPKNDSYHNNNKDYHIILCVYIYIYIGVHTYTCIYIYIYIHIHIHIRIHIYIYIHTYIHICLCLYTI